MNKKNILFTSLIIITIAILLNPLKKESNISNKSTYSNKYSLVYKINYAMKNKDYHFIKGLSEKDILETLFMEKYFSFAMKGLVLNNKDELAKTYANKVLDIKYNEIALSILIYDVAINNNEKRIQDVLEKYSEEKNSDYYIYVKNILKLKNGKNYLKSNSLPKKAYAIKYNAMQKEINKHYDEAKDLYKQSLDLKFLMSSLLLSVNLELNNGNKKDAFKILDELNNDKISFIYDEISKKIKNGEVKNRKIEWKHIVAEMMFDNSFISKDLEIILPYLSYKIDKSFELPLVLVISSLNSENITEQAKLLIVENEKEIVLRDIIENQIIDIIFKEDNFSGSTMKKLKTLSKKYPSNLLNYIKIASIYEKDNDLENAIKTYNTALKNTPYNDRKNWIIYFNIGVLHDKGDNWDEAEINLKKALQLNPNSPELLNYLGYSWLTRGKNKDLAIKMIEASLNSDPFNAEFIDSLGWGFYLIGDNEAAVNYLEPAKMIDNQNSVINYHLGVVYESLNRFREAKYQYEKAIRFDTKNKNLTSSELKDLKERLNKI